MERKVTYRTLNWQENLNEFTIDCTLKIALHPAESKVIFLIIPGVDGSIDGYENKYMRIADNVQEKHGAAVIRMDNPFITSHHWESNIRKVLEFIADNKKMLSGNEDIELRIMAHSVGATGIVQVAWEYPYISRLLLINPATRLNLDKFYKGLIEFNGKKTILVGSNDPSAGLESDKNIEYTVSNINILTIDGADHDFSGDAFPVFIEAPNKYLF